MNNQDNLYNKQKYQSVIVTYVDTEFSTKYSDSKIKPKKLSKRMHYILNEYIYSICEKYDTVIESSGVRYSVYYYPTHSNKDGFAIDYEFTLNNEDKYKLRSTIQRITKATKGVLEFDYVKDMTN